MLASLVGDTRMVDLLLLAGADVRAHSDSGPKWTASLAAYALHPEVLAQLLVACRGGALR
jgi:hypothetical protein